MEQNRLFPGNRLMYVYNFLHYENDLSNKINSHIENPLYIYPFFMETSFPNT